MNAPGEGTVAHKGDARPSGPVVPDEAVGGLMEGIEHGEGGGR